MGNQTASYDFLKECLTIEVLRGRKEFSWVRVIRRCLSEHKKRYNFWWRVANYLYTKDGKFNKKIASRINRKLTFKYHTEIELGTQIGTGLLIGHHGGILVTNRATIGKNFNIRQNTTIGLKKNNNDRLTIGDNVNVGANSCIIGEKLIIGDNVTIGAMSFVNKDIPSDCIYYTEKISKTVFKQ
ncbi:serine acetyltransferase [Obesumbacterium proteus]|uniref:serine acetyltransferase n=1 Tax=Obesumbacterium proteus TaxID=82983 RepID=UPI00242AC571|nr:serine acetyltransferase [Obesumbacterium proteus]